MKNVVAKFNQISKRIRDKISHREIGKVDEKVDAGDEQERYCDGYREGSRWIFQLFVHVIQSVPTTVSKDADTDGVGQRKKTHVRI